MDKKEKAGFIRAFINELPFFFITYFLLLPNIFTQYMKDDLYLWRFLQPFSCYGVDNSTALLLAFLLTVMVCLSKSRLLKWILYTIGLITVMVRLFLYISYKMWLNSSAVALLKETNPQESSEFFRDYVLSQNGAIALVFCVVLAAIIFFVERKRNQIGSFFLQGRRKWLLLMLLPFLLLGIYNLKFYVEVLSSNTNEKASNILDKYGFAYIARGHNTVMDLLVAFRTLKLAQEEDEMVADYALQFQKEAAANSSEKDVYIIYVLGESYIKSHAHLYGYELNTTPFLDKEKAEDRLFVFADVVAPFNLTYKVEKNSFFCNSMSDGEQWYASPSFMQIFRKAGFFVGFFDNQRTGEGFTLDNIKGGRLYNKTLASFSYSAISERHREYDGDFIEDIRNMELPDSGCNLHVYHLMGQHGPARMRYPQSFEKFKPADIKRKMPFFNDKNKAAIATYDNATLYNDHVVHQIIEMYKDKNAAMVYMSDHGEEMYDYRNSAGRAKANKGLEKQMAQHQFGVPFMIWCSELYKQNHPEKIEAIKNALNRPFMSDNLAQVLFNLAGLNTKYYRAERDLISPHYKERKRIIDDSGSMVCDYDELMRK